VASLSKLVEINWEVILGEKLAAEALFAAHCNPPPSDASLIEKCAGILPLYHRSTIHSLLALFLINDRGYCIAANNSR
jgi:hypothetical protein